ncbi:SAM-dependent methyltransferase [Streptomyces oceani]|uniref:Methyltransferase n=1 Tax=Streptomyces oceani TaxID=1075402 RepID=A0A1E7KJ43_9ACTN|nr:SAM-dependent methyltransferase [Streptomyces oceani]OEV03857.1 methyltransferase [Streptomyces oceani]
MAETESWMRADTKPSVELHTDRPHGARVYDVLLGGKTNYPADREAAEKLVEALPSAPMLAHQNRAFMHRATRYLAQEAGVRQFLDIGTGIPTSPNLHEVAQQVAPDTRVIYTDNDPIVLVHSRALHQGHPDGRTAYLEGDLTRPEDFLSDPELLRTFDLNQPVAVTLVAILHWLSSEQQPHELVTRIFDRLPSGSYLALTHVTDDFQQESMQAAVNGLNRTGANTEARSHAEVLRFFDGMELVDPGLEVVQRWRPDPVEIGADALGPADIPAYAGVGRKK